MCIVWAYRLLQYSDFISSLDCPTIPAIFKHRYTPNSKGTGSKNISGWAQESLGHGRPWSDPWSGKVSVVVERKFGLFQATSSINFQCFKVFREFIGGARTQVHLPPVGCTTTQYPMLLQLLPVRVGSGRHQLESVEFHNTVTDSRRDGWRRHGSDVTLLTGTSPLPRLPPSGVRTLLWVMMNRGVVKVWWNGSWRREAGTTARRKVSWYEWRLGGQHRRRVLRGTALCLVRLVSRRNVVLRHRTTGFTTPLNLCTINNKHTCITLIDRHDKCPPHNNSNRVLL